MRALSFALLFISVSAYCQNLDSLWTLTTFRSNLPYSYNILRSSQNTANVGRSEIGYANDDLALRDVYMQEKAEGLYIKSERFASLKNWKIFASFNFSKSEDRNRSFTDFVNPYRDNAYKIVDSSAADWRVQNYNLYTKIITPEVFKNFWAGIGIKYDILNGARQKDPRPLDKTINIELTPAVTYNIGSRIGISANAYYNRYMQDFSLSLENHLKNKEIYNLTGIGEYLFNGPILTTGISRNYRGNTYGGGLAISYSLPKMMSLSVWYNSKSGKETASEGTSNPFNIGDHVYSEHSVGLLFQKSSEYSEHKLSFDGRLKLTNDTEYVQTLNPTTQQYQVLYSAVMHTKDVYDVGMSYGFIKKNKSGLNYSVEAAATYNGFQEFYRSTLSKVSINSLNFALHLKKWLNFNDNILTVSVKADYNRNIDGEYRYYMKSYSENFVSKSIAYPNFLYSTLDFLGNRMEIQYILKPLNNTKNRIFLGTSYQNKINLTKNNLFIKRLVNNYFGIAVGLLN